MYSSHILVTEMGWPRHGVRYDYSPKGAFDVLGVNLECFFAAPT